MNRRALLTAISTVTTGIAGCTGRLTTDNPSSPTDGSLDHKWRHDIPGKGMTVAQGMVIGEEVFKSRDDPEADGGIFALDMETGDHLWTYGSSDPYYSGYATPVIADAIYTVKGDDTGIYNTKAIGFDGRGRWSQEGDLKHAANTTAYVVNEPSPESTANSQLTAVAGTGEELWTVEYSDEVSVAADTSMDPGMSYVGREDLTALATDDGSVQWQYDHEGKSIHVTAAIQGTVYITAAGGRFVVVEDGDPLWEANLASQATVQAVIDDTVYIEDYKGVYAFDAKTGERLWEQSAAKNTLQGEGPRGIEWHLHADGNRLYGAGNRLHAVELADGTEAWSTQPGDSEDVQLVSILNEEDTARDATLLVQADADVLYGIATDGTKTWSRTAPDPIQDVAAGQSIAVATETAIYGFDPQ